MLKQILILILSCIQINFLSSSECINIIDKCLPILELQQLVLSYLAEKPVFKFKFSNIPQAHKIKVISGFTFTPDNKLVIIGTGKYYSRKIIAIVDLSTKSVIQSAILVSPVILDDNIPTPTPVGIIHADDTLIVQWCNNQLTAIDPKTLAVSAILDNPNKSAYCSIRAQIGYSDIAKKIISMKSGTSFTWNKAENFKRRHYDEGFDQFALSPNGKRIAALHYNKLIKTSTLFFINLETDMVDNKVRVHGCHSFDWLSDSELISCCGNDIYLDTNTVCKKKIASCDTYVISVIALPYTKSFLSLEHSGKSVQLLFYWCLNTKNKFEKILVDSIKTFKLHKSPNERYIASAAMDDIIIYEFENTKQLLMNLLNANRKSKNAPAKIIVEPSLEPAAPVKTQTGSTSVKHQTSKYLQLQKIVESVCVIS